MKAILLTKINAHCPNYILYYCISISILQAVDNRKECTVSACMIMFYVTCFLGGVIIEFEELNIVDIIGKGSFSVVHHGHWQGKEVALKRIRIPLGIDCEQVLHTKEVAIMRNIFTIIINNYLMIIIIIICRKIQHPNIIHMHGCAVTDREIVIVMDCVNGANLHSMLFSKTKRKV